MSWDPGMDHQKSLRSRLFDNRKVVLGRPAPRWAQMVAVDDFKPEILTALGQGPWTWGQLLAAWHHGRIALNSKSAPYGDLPENFSSDT